MMDSTFKGSWLVNYIPNEYNFPDILITLAQIEDFFDKNGDNFNSININFNKNSNKNYFFKENDDIFLIFCDINKEFEEKYAKPCEPAVFKPLKKPIKTISLLFPRLESDPRWKSMGLPAGQLFLASNLRARGFAAAPLPFVLPAQNPPPGALEADLTGITLFEDLLPLLRPFLADFRAICKGIMAAGGPFPTLAPLATAFHLPQVNLYIRGEAEMAFPKVVEALNHGDGPAFFRQKGVFWQRPGLVAMAGFDQVNRPADFSPFQVDLGFLQAGHVEHGLEMNFSRGCGRGCLFCCRAQGNRLRKLPLEKVDELLKKYTQHIEKSIEKSKSPRQELPPLAKGVFKREQSSQIPPFSRGDKGGIEISGSESGRVTHPPLREPGPSSTEMLNSHRDSKLAYTVNINDDDILQDPDYAGQIFSLLKEHGFRIFGIQTSPASLLRNNGSARSEVLDLASDPCLYADGRPLLWLGTDAFLPSRASRLGKRLPDAEKFSALLGGLEARNIRHFHYWISSDGDSTWAEFVKELSLIFGFFRDFPGFGLLAHSPFIVPYPSSRMSERIEPGDSRLKLKLALDASEPIFSYKVVERLETKRPSLNKLLLNEKAGGERGFFDFLKEKDFIAAAQLAYHFLKQEQLQGPTNDPGLQRAREHLEQMISELLKLSDK